MKNESFSAQKNDAWTHVGYGGGGATFYPAVSPHNHNVAYLSCDMTGSFTTRDGGNSWRMFNLHGVVQSYVFDPLDSMVVYAIVGGYANGLYKSSNAGDTWSLLYPNPADVKGVVAKGDHADEKMILADSSQRIVLALAVDPEKSSSLFAAFKVNNITGFYTSNDAGLHWKKDTYLTDGAKNIYVFPASSPKNRTIYIAGEKSITVRDSGKFRINKGPKGVNSLTEFAGGFDQKSRKFIIYATAGNSYFDPKANQSGIYMTDDGGLSWQNREKGLRSLAQKNAPVPEWRSVATSALHPEVVYISYNRFKIDKDTTSIGVARSDDYGLTWELSWQDKLVKGGDLHAVNLEGGWINEQFGPTWGENPFSIGVSPTDPGVCYTTDFGRVIKTSNAGKTWKQVYTKKLSGGGWTTRGIEVNCSYSIVFNPFDKQHVFITNTDVGLMESGDGGSGWKSAIHDNGIPKQWINSTYWLAFDPEINGKAWAVMSGIHDLPRAKMWHRTKVADFNGGIVTTEDGGKSWNVLSSSTGEAAFTHILIDPTSDKKSRVVYACAFGKGIYKSIDGGISWILKNNGIEGIEPFAWRITRRESDGTLFAVIIRRSVDGSIGNKQDGALYRSDNGAETWTKILLPEGTNGPTSLVIDPSQNGTLILSAWGRLTKGNSSPDVGGGIFVSRNDGKSWEQVLDRDQHIHDITYDARTKTFYACGFTSSAYRSNDLTNWERIKGYNFKWGRRVDLDPNDPEKIYITTFGGGVWHGPAAGDPLASEDIN